MQNDNFDEVDLKGIWAMIVKKMNKEGEEVCPNSSSFYKTQDGIECSLRRKNGDLIGICYRENDRSGGYRWIIEKSIWYFAYQLKLKEYLKHKFSEFQALK